MNGLTALYMMLIIIEFFAWIRHIGVRSGMEALPNQVRSREALDNLCIQVESAPAGSFLRRNAWI